MQQLKSYERFQAGRDFIENREVERGLSAESYIYHLLYHVATPPPGKSLRLNYWGEPVSGLFSQFSGFLEEPPQEGGSNGGCGLRLTVPRPKGEGELPLFDYFFGDLFKLLDLDSFIQLFTCVLLENQVLLYSKGESDVFYKLGAVWTFSNVF